MRTSIQNVLLIVNLQTTTTTAAAAAAAAAALVDTVCNSTTAKPKALGVKGPVWSLVKPKMDILLPLVVVVAVVVPGQNLSRRGIKQGGDPITTWMMMIGRRRRIRRRTMIRHAAAATAAAACNRCWLDCFGGEAVRNASRC
jgi:hypothetical protein